MTVIIYKVYVLLVYMANIVTIVSTQSSNYVLVTPQPTAALYKKVGDASVSFACKVQGADYDPFSQPLEFVKKQGNADEIGVMIFQSVRPPFTNTGGRYTGQHTQKLEPIKEFELVITITDLKIEDSGEYICRVGASGPRVNYTLYVIDDVQELHIYGNDGSSPQWSNLQPATTVLNYDTTTTGMIQCVAIGGYPRPTLSIYVGEEQKTGFFTPHNDCNMTGPDLGLQRFSCITTNGDQNYRPQSSVNRQMFRCRAHISDLVPAKEASVQLNIKGAPKIIAAQCPNVVYGNVGTDVELKCMFISNPGPSSVSWRVDSSGIDVTSSNSKTKFEAVDNLIGDDVWEARLLIYEVVKGREGGDFHTYVLQVINQLGEMEQREIQLQQDPNAGAISQATSITTSSTTLQLLISILWIIYTLVVSNT